MRFLQVLLLRQCKIAYNPQLTRNWFSRSFTLTRQRAQIDLKKIHIFPRKRRCVWFHPCDYWYSSWFHRASQSFRSTSFRSTGLIFLLQFFAAFYLYIFNYEHYLKTPLVSGLQEFSWNETRMSETCSCRMTWFQSRFRSMMQDVDAHIFSGFTDVGQFERWSSRVGTL